MRKRGQESGIRCQGNAARWIALFALCACAAPVRSEYLNVLCSDRAAIERVYYSHRLGDKPPFEQVLSPALIERLVKKDLRKETALKRVYAVEITAAQLDAELQRINTTTRAPELLAELKAALGDDTNRFVRAVARPIVVERLLRDKFENDDTLHAPQRHDAEMLRERLLQARGNRGGQAPSSKSEIEQSRLAPTAANEAVEKLVALLKQDHSNAVTETTWQLRARSAETSAPGADDIEIKKRFGPNAQLLASPRGGHDREAKAYFEDLPGELRNVLNAQLCQPGDISAVIETPAGFLLYVARQKTDAALGVAGLFLPKRSYEQWLEAQSANEP